MMISLRVESAAQKLYKLCEIRTTGTTGTGGDKATGTTGTGGDKATGGRSTSRGT